VCFALPKNGQWLIRTIGKIRPYETYRISADKLGLDQSDISKTVVFLSQEERSGSYAELPTSDSFKSVPNWRANMSVCSESTCVSFQGDYPGQMLDIQNGTLVSISALIQSAPGISNKVFLANFTRRPMVRTAEVFFSRVKNGEIIKTAEVQYNQVNCIDLSDLALANEPGLIMMASKDIFGVPIYFSHDTEYRHLSLEHTHPPGEFTVFGSDSIRFTAVKKMKKFWLNYAHQEN
jgi:hypothetical protein